MKIKLSFILIFLFVSVGFAQDSEIEKNFGKDKKTFAVVKFAVGEDASSGWDYLVYKNKSGVRKIRVIWSSSYASPRVEDYYFENGKPSLYVKFAAAKTQYKSLKKGLETALTLEEKLGFTNLKLAAWTEKGKAVAADDLRWSEKETDVLEKFKSELESYESHLRGEL